MRNNKFAYRALDLILETKKIPSIVSEYNTFRSKSGLAPVKFNTVTRYIAGKAEYHLPLNFRQYVAHVTSKGIID